MRAGAFCHLTTSPDVLEMGTEFCSFDPRLQNPFFYVQPLAPTLDFPAFHLVS